MSTVKSFSKNEYIVHMGDKQHSVPFLASGIAMGLIETEDGKVVVDCIASSPGQPLIGFYTIGSPETQFYICEISVQAVTDCEVICIPLLIINQFVQQHSEAKQIYIQLLEASLSHHCSHKKMLLLPTPKDRLDWFYENYPEYVPLLKDKNCKPGEKAVKHKHVAAFLNITPQTLSKLLND